MKKQKEFKATIKFMPSSDYYGTIIIKAKDKQQAEKIIEEKIESNGNNIHLDCDMQQGDYCIDDCDVELYGIEEVTNEKKKLNRNKKR